MRLAFLILCLSAIALTLVTLRAEEVAAQQQIQRIQRQMVLQRRELWQLDAALGELTSVVALKVRAEEMTLTLLPPETEAANPAAGLACGEFMPFDNAAADAAWEPTWRPGGDGG